MEIKYITIEELLNSVWEVLKGEWELGGSTSSGFSLCKDLLDDDFGLVFRTSFVCNSSLYLSVSIYIEHGEFVVSTALNYLRDEVTPISKKSYSIDNKHGIIDDLSSMLSKLAELDKLHSQKL